MVELEKPIHPINMPVNMVSIDQNHCLDFDVEHVMSVFESERSLFIQKLI